MAQVVAYAALNMLSPQVWTGNVVETSSNRIVLSDGYFTGVYTGQGFTFSPYGLTGGTLTGFEQYAGGALQGAFTGGSVPAVTAAAYINANDIPGLLRIAAAGDDLIQGSSFGDRLGGYGGNDRIHSGGGSDYIDGGDGFDIAVYSGTLNQYNVMPFGHMVRVSGNGSHDTLAYVERVEFADLTLGFDAASVQTYRLYQAAFDRVPDLGGVSFWVNKIDEGTSLQTAAANFIDSVEFRALYGASPTDEQFVDLLYENVLNRDPDAGGYSYWAGRMDAGMSREAVLVEFSESAENKGNTLEATVVGVRLDPAFF